MDFRNFDKKKCYTFYRNLRSIQTHKHATALREKFNKDFIQLNVWDALDKLSILIDASDPDTNTPNIHHAFQTAEGARQANEPEWFILVCLIHDLGKMLYIRAESSNADGTSLDTQYSVVGDTFIVGCKLSKGLVLAQHNDLNPDMHNSKYNTKYGIYAPHTGFDNCLFSFGHDEYLYQVIQHNRKHNTQFKWDLPEEALYIIRYHSFYPWHSPLKGHKDIYTHLASETDVSRKELLHRFSNYDLYTKKDESIDIDSLKEYYNKLILKYIGTTEWMF